MRGALFLLLLVAAAVVPDVPGPLGAADGVKVVQETRTRQSGKKGQSSGVLHVALVKNVSDQALRGLRVTVELHDSFGKLLWAKTVTPGPAALKPGETASLSIVTPHFDAYKKTVYRFDYRAEAGKAPKRRAPA